MVKTLSHKGTKRRHKGTNSRSYKGSPLRLSVFTLRLCVKPLLASVLVFAALPAIAFPQAKPARFDPDGSFWILGEPPHEFSDFGAINLNAKRSRQLPVQGFELRTGKRLRFKTLIVKRNNLTFETIPLAGVSYAFSGKFLKGGVYSAGNLDDETPVLEGTLTKFRGGQKVAAAKLKFVYFGGT